MKTYKQLVNEVEAPTFPNIHKHMVDNGYTHNVTLRKESATHSEITRRDFYTKPGNHLKDAHASLKGHGYSQLSKILYSGYQKKTDAHHGMVQLTHIPGANGGTTRVMHHHGTGTGGRAIDKQRGYDPDKEVPLTDKEKRHLPS